MKTFGDYYADGMIPEDVINVAYDPSVIILPLSNAVDHLGATSSIKEWFDKTLRAPKIDNAIIDGAPAAADDTSTGIRYRQPMQLQEAGISLGDQAMESDSFDNIADFSLQLEDRTNELRRDTEANALSSQPSVLPVSNTTAGEAAGFFAQVATAVDFGGGGAVGGWNPSTGVFDAPTAGTPRPLSENTLLSVMATANQNGANLDRAYMVNALKAKVSNYMMTSSSRVGVLVTQTPTEGKSPANAVQSVQTYYTDYGSIELINDRLMVPLVATPGSTNTAVAIMETAMAACVAQWTPRAKRLGPAGAGETWQVTSSRGLILRTERSHAAVLDIDYEIDMVP